MTVDDPERTTDLSGLSDDEVAQRVAAGHTNDVPTRAARSVSEIIRANVFTRINAILGTLFLIVLATGSVINGLFGLLIVKPGQQIPYIIAMAAAYAGGFILTWFFGVDEKRINEVYGE